MQNRHEPDPRFVESLEWQLRRELRRGKGDTAPHPIFGTLKIAGLMLCSVAVGAVAIATSHKLQDSWRKELLEARLEVQLQQAYQRLDIQLDAIGLTREQVEEGLQTDQELAYFELRIAEVDADAKVLELELEEIRSSGREPLGELSSPLVDERDFVTERIEARQDAARHRLEVFRNAGERIRQRVEAGVVDQREWQAQDLMVMEAELQLQVLTQQLKLRQAFLDSEISAIEAELGYLEVQARSQVAQSDQRRQYFQSELDRLISLIEAGVIRPAAAADMRTQMAAIDAELHLAREELRIVRQELERRAE
jgi:hypothetical protein